MFDVLPDGRCGCLKPECKSPGKHTATGFSVHGTAPGGTTIEPAFLQGKEHNWGVMTGRDGGVVVVDIDMKSAEKNGMELMAKEFPDLLAIETFTVGTPTGAGQHRYFSTPPGWQATGSKPVPFHGAPIDFKGFNGYVVAPPSVGANGRPYHVIADLPIAPLPQKYLDLWHDPKSRAQSLPQAAPVRSRDVDPDEGQAVSYSTTPAPYEVEWAEAFLARAEPAVQGENGSLKLFNVAQALVVVRSLDPAWSAVAIDRIYNQRCSPPWSRKEIEHKVRSALSRSSLEPEPMIPPIAIAPMVEAVATAKAVRVVERRDAANAEERFDVTRSFVDNPKSLQAIDESKVIEMLVHHPRWKGVLGFDKFTREDVCSGPPLKMDAETIGWTEVDSSRVSVWVKAQGYNCSSKKAFEAARVACGTNERDTLQEYMAECKEAHESMSIDEAHAILSYLATTVLGQSENIKIEMVKKTMVAGALRALKPGAKVDTMLVLIGDQGCGKSTFVRALAGKPAWYCDNIGDLASRDSRLILVGKHVVEMDELASMGVRAAAIEKSFLSASTDKVREVGTKTQLVLDRRCIFIGTTNEGNFLSDSTGSRRFWPITIPHAIDTTWVETHRSHLWAAAQILLAAGEQHWLTIEQSVDLAPIHSEHKSDEDPWTEAIIDRLRGKMFAPVPGAMAASLFEDRVSSAKRGDATRVKLIYQHLEMRPTSRMEGGRKVNCWTIPPEL